VKFLVIAFILAVAPVAYGLDVPKKSAADARIQRVDYNENDVVEITAAVGTATHIVLDEGENVLDMASGFSAGWEVTAPRNNIYLKPKTVGGSRGNSGASVMTPDPEKWNTNLVVTTNRRTYSFQLVLLTENDERKPAFRVIFRYPEDEKVKHRKQDEQQKVMEKLEQQPIPRNWKYTMQIGDNSADIAPTMAWDDGRFTYLQFPGNREFPSIFFVAQDKGESLVDVFVDPKAPDVLVVRRVARELVLRLSKMVVSVYNEDFDSFGTPPKDGTAQEGVRRILRSPVGKFVQEIEEIPSPITGAPPEYIQDQGGLK
jgi:type IV secretion system protein VirB9/type IV secretion system protein PtlF